MRVKLLSATDNPVQIMYIAARTCREEGSPIDVWETVEKPGHLIKLNPKGTGTESVLLREQEQMVSKVIGYGHESIMEHVHFSFLIEGASRALTHQLVRHRLCTFSQQSLRAVKPGNFVPPYMFFDANTDPTVCDEDIFDLYDHSMKLYDKLVKAGVPLEKARWVLPIGTLTNIMMSHNLRELRHICRLRLCLRAQEEIREMMGSIHVLVKSYNNFVGSLLGAKCDLGEVCNDVCPKKRNE